MHQDVLRALGLVVGAAGRALRARVGSEEQGLSFLASALGLVTLALTSVGLAASITR